LGLSDAQLTLHKLVDDLFLLVQPRLHKAKTKEDQLASFVRFEQSLSFRLDHHDISRTQRCAYFLLGLLETSFFLRRVISCRLPWLLRTVDGEHCNRKGYFLQFR